MEQLLNIYELAQVLGVKISTLYAWSHQGRIPRVKVGHLLRFRASEVEAWLNPKTSKDDRKEPEQKPKRRIVRRGRAQDSHINTIIETAKAEVLK